MNDLTRALKFMLTPAKLELLTQPLFAAQFVDEVMDLVAAHSRTEGHAERATNRALRYLRAIERHYDFKFDLPTTYRPKRPPTPLRRANWAGQSQAMFDLAAQLEHQLKQRGLRGERLASLTLLSAILNGALLRPQGWLALWARLREGKAVVKRAPMLGNHVWLDLDIGPKEVLRFYPDVITLGLLARCRSLAPSCQLPVFKSVRPLLRHLQTCLDLPQPLDAATLADAGFAPLEDRLNANIPQVLFAVANGSLQTSAVPPEQWEACLRGTKRTPVTGGTGHKPIRAPQVHQSSAKSEQALAKALRTKRKGAQKVTITPVSRALEDILASAPTPIVRARIYWFQSLLKRGRKVSTVRRYNSALSSVTQLAFMEADPADMSTGEIETRLNAVLEASHTHDATIGARLHHFFQFAADAPQLYWPEPVLDLPQSTGKSQPRVAIVSGVQITHALNQSREQPSLTAALLLAARGGLRLSDMEALLLRDVEAGPTGVVRIHPTKEGDIKTAAGRRQVPLPLLLSGAELNLWQSYCSMRRQSAANFDEPFLGQATPLLGVTRFDRFEFAHFIASAIGLRPHDLRHGALSNLALALLAPEQSKPVRQFTGWSAARIAALRQEFSDRDSQGGMHQLARLAGHRAATTSFETYLHLSDLALGLHIAAIKDKRPAAEAARILGLNARSIGSKKTITLEDLRPRILSKLKVQDIKPTKAKPKATPPPTPPVATPDLILRLCGALQSGWSPYAVAQRFGVPQRLVLSLNKLPALPPAPRRKGDRLWARRNIDKLLEDSEPLALIHLIRTAPRQAMFFAAPASALRWLNGFGANLRSDLCLELPEGADPGRWSEFMARTSTARSARLRVEVTTPSGTDAVPLLKYAAEVADRTLIARDQIS